MGMRDERTFTGSKSNIAHLIGNTDLVQLNTKFLRLRPTIEYVDRLLREKPGG